MKIAIVGTGYVGLVTGACFSDMGNDVWCVDVDSAKIDSLSKGVLPIYEPGLDTLVKTNFEQGRLRFTTSLSEALAVCEVCFIAVGTPTGEDGGADLQYVLAVADEIGGFITAPLCVIDKSTVPVGTAKLVRQHIQTQLDKRGLDVAFDVVSNPEFLKEGTAIEDCFRPDRIVIGVDNDTVATRLKQLYKPFISNTETFIVMDIVSAEMTKYAANSMLATKISFMNEIANICERVGANVNNVRLGIGADRRIGYHFIYPGCGYGGSCFPKDVHALIHSAHAADYRPRLLEAVDAVNYDQKKIIPAKVKARFGKDLTGLTFAVWGLAFKPNTDDMRESAAITIITELTDAGAKVNAYDPKATEEARRVYLKGNANVTYTPDKYTAASGADALILVTEWKEFRTPDLYEIRKRLKNAVIFDGRNQYDAQVLREQKFEYFQIGVV